MNDLGDAHLRTWTLRLMTLLAADTQDQLVWLGERELETESLVEEVELLCRVSEGLVEREVFEPKDLRDLRAVGRRLGEIDTDRAGLWAKALATDPAWDEIRPLAAGFSSRRWATGTSRCHVPRTRNRTHVPTGRRGLPVVQRVPGPAGR